MGMVRQEEKEEEERGGDEGWVVRRICRTITSRHA
jgi:hypothetical protein